MQNKPNFRKAQMNVNPYNTKEYENKWQRGVRKNKPNSNPISKYYPKGTGRKKGFWEVAERAIFFLSQNRLIPHYIVRTRILKNFLRC
jgi:hypothetical protein